MKAGLLAFALASSGLLGCASLPRADEAQPSDRVRLTSGGLRALDGLYAYAAYDPRCTRADGGGLCPVGFFSDEALGGPRARESVAYGDTTAALALRVRDGRHVEATVLVGGASVSERVLTGGVDRDGYFVLDSRLYFGVLPVGWVYTERKARLGVDSGGRLLVDAGAGGCTFFLLVLPFCADSQHSYAFERRAE